ncbi:MAG: acyltransferase [Marinobacter sp.]|nr:acyltransferase [Marinobacter sp.]
MTMRTTLKRSIKWLFLALALPVFGLFLVIRTATGSDDSFASFSQFLSLIPGKVGVYLRAAFYHLACPDTSDDISIGFLTILSHRDTSIGKGVYIGPQGNIGMCRIGENTLLGSGVHILSGSRQHEFRDIDRPIKEQGGMFEKITIGNDCWIGNQAIVMSPTAAKSIIAAGSVVISSVESGDIVAGNPARVLRNRFKDSQTQKASREARE